MNWGLIAAGLGVLAVVMLGGILLAASGVYGVGLVAFLPIAAVIGGAIVLAGREPS